MVNSRNRVFGIVGSRDFPDLEAVDLYVQQLGNVDVVSGGARGVDKAAEFAALASGLHVTSYRPFETDRGLFVIYRWLDGEDNGMYGSRVYSGFTSAALARNGLIVRDCDELTAFWDGFSTGTKHTIDLARNAERRVHIITVT